MPALSTMDSVTAFVPFPVSPPSLPERKVLSYRVSITATWARVTLVPGDMVVLVVPVRMPLG